jgi:hypothetical protein
MLFLKHSLEILLETRNVHIVSEVRKVISFKQMLRSVFTIFMTISAEVYEIGNLLGGLAEWECGTHFVSTSFLIIRVVEVKAHRWLFHFESVSVFSFNLMHTLKI